MTSTPTPKEKLIENSVKGFGNAYGTEFWYSKDVIAFLRTALEEAWEAGYVEGGTNTNFTMLKKCRADTISSFKADLRGKIEATMRAVEADFAESPDRTSQYELEGYRNILSLLVEEESSKTSSNGE